MLPYFMDLSFSFYDAWALYHSTVYGKSSDRIWISLQWRRFIYPYTNVQRKYGVRVMSMTGVKRESRGKSSRGATVHIGE
jgi:hypothetical protein